MCGIAGIFGAGDSSPIQAMTSRLAHRGPDGLGVIHHGAAHLGATRLSLVDFEHGVQPIVSDDGRLALVFNGEIYNHDDRRRALTASGAGFRGRCDTEVLLRAFERDGPACVESLEGMWAFAISDGDRLWLGRDPFGIKPLVYAVVDDGRTLIFASELKALLAHPAVPRRLDRSALFDQAVFGFILHHKTYFAAIREVPPSTLIDVSRGADGRLRLTSRRHSPVPPLDLPSDGEAIAEMLLERLRQSVHEQREADHPVGAYLSGGVDSSLLVALMTEGRREPVHTFASADTPQHPDLAMARGVAEHFRTVHHEHLVCSRDLLDALPSAVVNLESTAPSSIAEIAAPRLRPHVKAALCGDGADELFAGYIMHAQPDRWLHVYGERYNRLVRGGGLSPADVADALAMVKALAAKGLAAKGQDPDSQELRDRFYRFYLDDQLTSGHLRRWDLGTMTHGLELRVPYLSKPLRDFASSLSWDQRIRGRVTKVALRAVARRILPPPLADAIVERRKYAAPSAYVRSTRVLDRYLRLHVPERDTSDPHPLRACFATPVERCTLDLFVLCFVGHGGHLPDGLDVRELYRRHRDDLADALVVATSGDALGRA